MKADQWQKLQILTNIAVVITLIYFFPESENDTIDLVDKYVDVAALKCPSSYDDETQSFRNTNYWLFHKKPADPDISMISRPDRNTGTWNFDVGSDTGPMIVTPDTLAWTSFLFTGNEYSLNRKDLTMQRKRLNRSTISSECETVSTEDAREAVTERYLARLEGNEI